MKTVITQLIALLLMVAMLNTHAKQLSTEKSRLLLDNIRDDISYTLSSVADIEPNQDWTVYLSQSNARLVRMGVVIEPSTRTVLSVTADGTAKAVGLQVGDVIEIVKINGQEFTGSLSSAELMHGDKLTISVIRSGKSLKLKHLVTSSYIPNWELYSSTTDLLGTTLKSASDQKLNMSLQSEKSLELLKKLEARINFTLSEIYKLESKERKKLALNMSKVARVNTELGITLDDELQVLSVKQASNAERFGVEVGDFIESYRHGASQELGNDFSTLKLEPGSDITLNVRRDGKQLALSGRLKPTVNPSWSMRVTSQTQHSTDSCGVVTVFFDPPATRDVYRAQITEVNGDLLPKSSREDTVVLPAGHHEILVHDNIPSNMKRRNSRGKLIEFKVVPNKRYYLGAKYDRSKRFSTRGQYWQPYVWKVEDYECSLDD